MGPDQEGLEVGRQSMGSKYAVLVERLSCSHGAAGGSERGLQPGSRVL